jgi:adenylate kinase family enzyme
MLNNIRIAIVGTSGSGKTTLAQQISRQLGIQHVELDAYRHGPNWTETPNTRFRCHIRQALSTGDWIADGNYSAVRDIVWSKATKLIWLDYPVNLVLWRLLKRTLKRCLLREELWNGNRENILQHFFTRDSLFLWALKTHWSMKTEIQEALKQPEYSHIQVTRINNIQSAKHWKTIL